MKRKARLSDKEHYTIPDLLKRYGVARSSIYRMFDKGFPKGGVPPGGRDRIILASHVHAWERVYMPWLQEPVEEAYIGPEEEDEKRWTRVLRSKQLKKLRERVSRSVQRQRTAQKRAARKK